MLRLLTNLNLFDGLNHSWSNGKRSLRIVNMDGYFLMASSTVIRTPTMLRPGTPAPLPWTRPPRRQSATSSLRPTATSISNTTVATNRNRPGLLADPMEHRQRTSKERLSRDCSTTSQKLWVRTSFFNCYFFWMQNTRDLRRFAPPTG